MFKKLITLIMLITLLLFSVSAIFAGGETESTSTGDEKTTIKLAMVNLSLCCPYFIGMSQAVEDEASAYPNIEIIVTDANGDAEKLTSDIEDVLV